MLAPPAGRGVSKDINLIVTVTINPAVDRNVSADRLVFEDRAYILNRCESAGGRGINASNVIHSFGGETLAIVTSGGKTGKKFEELLATSSFPVEVVRIRGEIRTNFTISDKQGLTIKLNERGPKIEKAELGRIEKTVRARLSKAKCLMLCGSLPPDVGASFYSRLIHAAKQQGVPTLLDTDGPSLAEAIEAGPSVVTPNQSEAEQLLGRALITRAHFLDALERIHGMGAACVILSLGARGAVGIKDGAVVEAIPPRIDAVCPIGAGDAMAAAYLWSSAQGNGFADSVRWGVAAGTASAKLPGLQFASLEQTRKIYAQVEMR